MLPSRRQRQRSDILSDLALLRARIGAWPASGCCPEHCHLEPDHAPLPADFWAVRNQIQALKRELLLLP